MTSLSASSLDVVRYYATAMESSSNNQFDDARTSLVKAVEADPKFGVGYLALAGVSRNMGKPDDAMKYVNEALSHLDGMTERERYTTRGMFYRMTGDYQQCVKETNELLARFAADVVGHNQLAICASQLRDIAPVTDERHRELLPERDVSRQPRPALTTQ
jgi:tetratricopeptide (TPR) repeat protein